MSVVLGVATNNTVVLMSDGRVSKTDEDGNFSVVDENYPKVIQVNKYVGVGFTGSTELCKAVTNIIGTLDQNIKASIKVDQLFKILFLRARAIKQLEESGDRVVQILVAGINERTQIEIKTTSSALGFRITSDVLQNEGDVIFAELSAIKDSDPHTKFQSFLMRQKNLKESMAEYIDYVSTFDRSVNRQKFMVWIKRD